MFLTLLWITTILSLFCLVLIFTNYIRSGKSSQQAGRELRDELRIGREEARNTAQDLRQEISESLKYIHEITTNSRDYFNKTQQNHLEGIMKFFKEMADTNHSQLDRIRNTFDIRVKELQEGNEKKLEEMRKTVDEKLHDTLEKRLGESFKLVSDRLETVHKGLGEMQNLATGVGELKRVLTNVKARGTWAEVQLGAILEQILSPDQYEKNVRIRGESLEQVEFAIKLPGPSDEPQNCVWLPIDSKFPQEDYLRLQSAAEKADQDGVKAASDALVRTIRAAAKEINQKYVYPPNTTDFGIMFLATEGLYSEALRQPGLLEDLQQNLRVILAGPATLAAILSSLRMGFQTLAIQKHAAEVWRVLAAVKTEFGKFGDVLDKLKRQLHTASATIEKTGVRSRAMQKRLNSVTELPALEASKILSMSGLIEDEIFQESQPEEEYLTPKSQEQP